MMPAAVYTPGAQSPVASNSSPLTTGLATAPISEIRFSSPNTEPRSLGGTMSPVMPCTIGCSALKNRPEVNSSTPSSSSDGSLPSRTLKPNARARME
jgi:hypothetical protein